MMSNLDNVKESAAIYISTFINDFQQNWKLEPETLVALSNLLFAILGNPKISKKIKISLRFTLQKLLIWDKGKLSVMKTIVSRFPSTIP